MDYAYVAYTRDRRLVKGKLSATSEEVAVDILGYGGYQVLSLKQFIPFFDKRKLASRFSQLKPTEIVMFSRQLALLLEAGIDIVTSLGLLQNQTTSQTLKRVIGEVVADIRGGSALSVALSKHPRVFSQLYHRAISAGEQGGNLEVVLRQMADHIEKGVTTEKKVKGALTYPIIVGVVAIVVVGILVSYVLPSFTSLYAAFDVELPLPTRIVMGISDWFSQYGLYLGLGIAAIFGSIFAYVKTPAGKYQWDSLLLRLPVFGRINLLNQLSRCCRTMALLFKVGVPVPEIMVVAIYGTTNKVVAEALTEIQGELLKGEGLSQPMSRRKLFLPLMVQMVGVGEETGNLDATLTTVAQSYEAEAEDKTSAAVALIQPAMTIIIGAVVGFIALSLISAMYSIYGEVSF
ncbi:MAG: type II secretion system F family protein [Chloroflexi bacterium]|nr:type II secretion system F family protein [Chloroflexota bacterium]